MGNKQSQKTSEKHGCCSGPGYATPLDAYLNGPREKILYTTCVRYKSDKPDYLATVDVDPDSETYSEVIHRLVMPNVGDELHHSGWNACSSCFGNPTAKRSHLILPCLNSSRIYVIDMTKNPRAPVLQKTVEQNQVTDLGSSFPHTSHCLPDGNIMISILGDENYDAKGNFLLLDNETFDVKGKWSETDVAFNYDYWYQPYHNVMISSEWGAPNVIKTGLSFDDIKNDYFPFNFENHFEIFDYFNTHFRGLDCTCILIPYFCNVFIGGSIVKDGGVGVIQDNELLEQPEALVVKGRKIDGGPQMLQLSLDGKRLYVTTSLYSQWDQQFYPEMIRNGACMLLIDVDTENGGMEVNPDFLVDFGKDPNGPALAHEMRYPGGDCSSDIWLHSTITKS